MVSKHILFLLFSNYTFPHFSSKLFHVSFYLNPFSISIKQTLRNLWRLIFLSYICLKLRPGLKLLELYFNEFSTPFLAHHHFLIHPKHLVVIRVCNYYTHYYHRFYVLSYYGYPPIYFPSYIWKFCCSKSRPIFKFLLHLIASAITYYCYILSCVHLHGLSRLTV